jgi:hypothetical protein
LVAGRGLDPGRGGNNPGYRLGVAGSTSRARRCGAAIGQSTRNPPVGVSRDGHRAGFAAACTASAAPVLGSSVPGLGDRYRAAVVVQVFPDPAQRCRRPRFASTTAAKSPRRVARTTTDANARFNARRPEPPRLRHYADGEDRFPG